MAVTTSEIQARLKQPGQAFLTAGIELTALISDAQAYVTACDLRLTTGASNDALVREYASYLVAKALIASGQPTTSPQEYYDSFIFLLAKIQGELNASATVSSDGVDNGRRFTRGRLRPWQDNPQRGTRNSNY